jgi:hypothetical protein
MATPKSLADADPTTDPLWAEFQDFLDKSRQQQSEVVLHNADFFQWRAFRAGVLAERKRIRGVFRRAGVPVDEEEM